MRRHRPISKGRWQASQQLILDQWRQKDLLAERELEWDSFLPILAKHSKDLSDNACILEVGSGPLCISQMFPQKQITYLDPLMDDLRRMFPDALPESECLCSNAERIPKPDGSYDLIICLDTLPYTQNPELVVHELERLLKPSGRLVLAMSVHSAFEARRHYWTERIFPVLHYGKCPYVYSLKGIHNTLSRHFVIVEEQVINNQLAWLPLLKREERLFVCEQKKQIMASDS